jgi:hypothetical protein
MTRDTGSRFAIGEFDILSVLSLPGFSKYTVPAVTSPPGNRTSTLIGIPIISPALIVRSVTGAVI